MFLQVVAKGGTEALRQSKRNVFEKLSGARVWPPTLPAQFTVCEPRPAEVSMGKLSH